MEDFMKILALDSSGLTASAAIVEDGVLTVEYTVTDKKTHSQTLLPMIDTIIQMLDIPMEELDAVAIAKGPGSFTGLRIGSATAKGLAFVLKKPIIPVPTVDALAYNLYGVQAIICPLMDARRNQAYTGLYTFEQTSGGMEFFVLCPQKAVFLEEILMQAEEFAIERQTGIIFLGDGVPVFRDQIARLITVPYSYAPQHVNLQRAGAVGVLGLFYYHRGLFEEASEYVPEYLRLSQAERKREEKFHIGQDMIEL